MKFIFLFIIISVFYYNNKIIEGNENQDSSSARCVPKNNTDPNSVHQLCAELESQHPCIRENACEWKVHVSRSSDPDGSVNESSSEGSETLHTDSDSGVTGGVESSTHIEGEDDNKNTIIIVSLSLFALVIVGVMIYKFSQNAEKPPLTPVEPVS
jgi:hypothetical protein